MIIRIFNLLSTKGELIFSRAPSVTCTESPENLEEKASVLACFPKPGKTQTKNSHLCGEPGKLWKKKAYVLAGFLKPAKT